MEKFLENVGLFTWYAWIHFLKFKKSFYGGWDMKFGERRTLHVEGLPTAIKAQVDGFFKDGWRLFFRGKKEGSMESKGRDPRPHTSRDFPAGKRALLGTFVIDFFIPIILLL